MYTIIGKGFGLYGYLPAVLMNNSRLTLPFSYRNFINLREDIREFSNKIIWSKNIKEAIERSQNIIFALPPLEQFRFILDNKNLLKDKNIFLEKPVANSPKNSFVLLELLKNENIKFCVNYSFIFLEWFNKFKKEISNLDTKDQVFVNWFFYSHHLKNNISNWKSQKDLGGGIIRFYGIHLIALFSYLKYDNCKLVNLSDNKVNFNLIGKNRPEVNIKIKINSRENKFSIRLFRNKIYNEEIIIDYKDPFDNPQNDLSETLDRRVDQLRNYIYNKKNIKYDYKNYFNVIKLWQKIECTTIGKC
jgi:hypothetical protein